MSSKTSRKGFLDAVLGLEWVEMPFAAGSERSFTVIETGGGSSKALAYLDGAASGKGDCNPAVLGKEGEAARFRKGFFDASCSSSPGGFRSALEKDVVSMRQPLSRLLVKAEEPGWKRSRRASACQSVQAHALTLVGWRIGKSHDLGVSTARSTGMRLWWGQGM